MSHLIVVGIGSNLDCRLRTSCVDIHGGGFPQLWVEAWGLSLTHWMILCHLFRLLLWFLVMSGNLGFNSLVDIFDSLWFDNSLFRTGDVLAELEV
jgi:hypothetical protein